ncbi:MAG: GNAT family N-acetyltransferase [Paludibacter sp.]|nr:GNAT family N-acetyltransferase [Paludibacter sp.]
MNIKQRRYQILMDFEKVHRFLTDTYNFETLNSYLLPQYFEYAHHLQWFDYIRSYRMGLWEDDGELVGVACYEIPIGTVHLHTKPEYSFLLLELLKWSKQEISICENDKHLLNVWITDKENEKQNLLKENGYQLVHTEPAKIFCYEKEFVERKLPEGYQIIDSTNVDPARLAKCFWLGFDHNELPSEINTDGNIQMLNAPRADKSLMTIVVAPNGEYACALGMWFDEQNKYAYLEPLATVPEYRRMGLATIALTEAMKKTKKLGATYCFGGGREFYTCIGFETTCNRELWKKEW